MPINNLYCLKHIQVRRQRMLNTGAEGGARSMTGGAGQLIVNMTKTGCCYYYFFI